MKEEDNIPSQSIKGEQRDHDLSKFIGQGNTDE